MSEHTNEMGQPVGYEIPDWKPCPWPEKMVLEGMYCRLVPVRPQQHARELYDAFALSKQGKNWTYGTACRL